MNKNYEQIRIKAMVQRPQSAGVKPRLSGNVAVRAAQATQEARVKVVVGERSSLRSRVLQLVIAAGVGALTITLFIPNRQIDETSAVAALPHAGPAPFQALVAAPGRVEAISGMRDLSFDVPGKIRNVFVEQGKPITAGQLVAELEDDHAVAQRDAARAGLAEAQARYAIVDCDLKANLVRAEQEVARLKAELALLVAGPRAEQIDAARMITASAEAEATQALEDKQRYFDPAGKYECWAKQLYDQAHRRSEAAAGRRDAAKAHLHELQAGSRTEELVIAKAQLASAEAEFNRQLSTRQLQLNASVAQVSKAKANLDHAEAELKRMRLTSPITGVVVWKFLHGGEVIDAIQQRPVISVADLTQLRIRAFVDETDYPRVLRGQRVKISADAFGEKCFYGRVELIGSAAGEKPFSTGDAREKQDIRVIETLVRLDEPTPLKLGLRVTTFFETGAAEGKDHK
jgi:multidrug resistance efflux pump